MPYVVLQFVFSDDTLVNLSLWAMR